MSKEQAVRNPYLTAGMERVLRQMLALEDDEELTHAMPGGWWLGDEQVSGQIGYGLLRMCLIHRTQDSRDDYERFTINEEGRAVLESAAYVPKIVAAMKARRGSSVRD